MVGQNFLNFPRSLTHDKTPKVHRQIFLEEPHHGKMYEFLVPVLELLFSCLDASSVKKILGEETLKTSPFLQPQTTHFRHFCRIHCNCLDTLDVKNPIWHHHPIPSLRGYYHARLGNLFGIPQNSAINPIPDLLNSGIFIGILFFRS